MGGSDYNELHGLFNLAEEKIKTVEHLDFNGILIPAINELRYAGQHCLTSLTSGDKEKATWNIHEAKDHCKRAIYDAMEMGVVFLLEKIKFFQIDYKWVIVTDVLPDYISNLKKIEEIQNFISTTNRLKITDDDYKEIQNYFDQTKRISKEFELSRNELNKKIRKYKLSVIISLVMIAISIAGFIIKC